MRKEGIKLMPLVSIIMGVYNCKSIELLKKSVQSIISQSFTDWEFIICNDGSNDETIKILEQISAYDSRMRIIGYTENRGLAYALNECIKVANGYYIARQDDDDYSRLDRLEKQIKFLEENKSYSFVGATAKVFNSNGIFGKYSVPEMPQKKDFLWNSPFIHPAVVFRKNDLIKAECYKVTPETYRCEDYDLFMRMYALGMKGYNIQETIYCYKITINSKKYRPMKSRMDEAKIRYAGFRKMGVLYWGFIFVFKPIIIGMIPQFIFRHITKRQYT